MPSKLAYPDENKELRNGTVYWSKTRTNRRGAVEVWVVCKLHEYGRWVRAAEAVNTEYTARCKDCYNQNQPKKLHSEQLLPKGTKVLFHTRVPGNRQLIAIQCRACFQEMGELKFVQQASIMRYIRGRGSWDELCSDCVRSRGSLARLSKDKISLKSGTVTQFSKEKDGMVPVLSEACQHTWWTTRINAVNNWHIYVEICPDCQRNPRTLAARFKELGAGNGNGQKNGEKHSSVGRPPKDRDPEGLSADDRHLKDRFEEIVRKLNRDLPQHKIKRKAIVDEYHAAGEVLAASTVTERVKRFYGNDISVEDSVALVLRVERQ